MKMHPISYFENQITSQLEDAQSMIDYIGSMCNIPKSEMENALEIITHHAQIALHFHPDRLNDDFISVASSLLKTGYYKNQFETLK